MLSFSFLKTKGSGLIEVVFGMAIILAVLVSIITAYNFFLKTSNKNTNIIKADFLLEEGIEAVRSIRDTDWSIFFALPADTDKFLSFQNGLWTTTDTNTFVDGVFERKFVVREIYRDNYDDIAETGYLDDGSRKVDVFVSWSEAGATTTVSETIVLANLFE